MSLNYSTVILGAELAGISAGSQLLKNNHISVIYESS